MPFMVVVVLIVVVLLMMVPCYRITMPQLGFLERRKGWRRTKKRKPTNKLATAK